MRSPLRFPEPPDPHLSLRIPPDSLITGPASGDISNEACRSLNCSSSRYCSRFLENRDVSTKDIGTIRHWRIAAKKFFGSFGTTVCPVLLSDILLPSAQTPAVRETGCLMQNWGNHRFDPVLSHKLMFQRLERSNCMGFCRIVSLRTWNARLVSETRRKTIHVGSGPASLRATVSATSLAFHIPDRGTGFMGQ